MWRSVHDAFTVLRCLFAVDFDFLEFTRFSSHYTQLMVQLSSVVREGGQRAGKLRCTHCEMLECRVAPWKVLQDHVCFSNPFPDMHSGTVAVMLC